MLFGAIDVGTNSIHLIVVELDAAFDTSRVVYKARAMVRLGSDDALERGHLSRKAMDRGVEAIARFAEAAHARGANRIRAVATSAVRETDNGEEFRAMVEARVGLRLEILDGNEEARLIHLGVMEVGGQGGGGKERSGQGVVPPRHAHGFSGGPQ